MPSKLLDEAAGKSASACLKLRILIPMLLGACLVAGAHGRQPAPAATQAPLQRFGFSAVKDLARNRAQRPFQEPTPLPKVLRQLNYDQYRLIAFRHERALWREPPLPFWLEFHHRGCVSKDKADIVLVEDGQERRVHFDPELFQYRGELASMKTSRDWGFAGFRLLCRLPSRPNYQEFCSFQGASYFRALCTNQVYGASARGLAVNIGLSRPEEFPGFRTFWIERPLAQSRSIRAWALLDGPSVTGAYEFVITPGLEQTTLDVECALFIRRPVDKLGIAPMSSMWAWAGGQPVSESRPQVHDSDGLLIAGANGEWLWRALARRDNPSVSRYQFRDPKGFGLMQRDRELDHYRDNEAKYHLRPSIWIKPRKQWQAGTVELLEFSGQTETADNVAAYWVPEQPVRSGDVLSFAYQVAFAKSDPEENRGGRFVNTRVNRLAGRDLHFGLVMKGSALQSLAADTALQPVVTASKGRVIDLSCSKFPGGDWLLGFRLVREDDGPVELRAFVRQGSKVLTETWSYLCT